MRDDRFVAEWISTGIETSDSRNCPFQIARDAMSSSLVQATWQTRGVTAKFPRPSTRSLAAQAPCGAGLLARKSDRVLRKAAQSVNSYSPPCRIIVPVAQNHMPHQLRGEIIVFRRAHRPCDQCFHIRIESAPHLHFDQILLGFLQTFRKGSGEADRQHQGMSHSKLPGLGGQERLEKFGVAAFVHRGGKDHDIYAVKVDVGRRFQCIGEPRVTPGLAQFVLDKMGDLAGLAFVGCVNDQGSHDGSPWLGLGQEINGLKSLRLEANQGDDWFTATTRPLVSSRVSLLSQYDAETQYIRSLQRELPGL